MARSYSALKANYALESSQYALDNLRLNAQRLGPGSFNKRQVEIIDSIHNLAIRSFQKIVDLNPNYDTRIVGSARTKMYNEHMDHYMTLSMFYNEEEARKRLKKNWYDVHFLNYAKNLLNSCPQNSTLFVTGDNATYAALYAQKVYGIREDVSIICTSYLWIPAYVNYIQESTDIDFSIRYNLKNKEEFNYVLALQEGEKMTFDDFWIKLKKEHAGEEQPRFKGLDTMVISQGEHAMEVNFKIHPISRSDLTIMEIIHKNYPARSICYTGSDSYVLKALDKYSELNGLVQVLNPAGIKERKDTKVNILWCSDSLETLLINNYSWAPASTRLSMDSFYHRVYQFPFQCLIKELKAKKEYDKTLKVMSFFDEQFPDYMD